MNVSKWTHENNSARYVMIVAGKVCDKLVGQQGPSAPIRLTL